MANRVYCWIDSLLEACFPTLCVLCHRWAPPPLAICPDCQTDLPLNTPACSRCGEPLPTPTATLCGRCLYVSPPYDTLHAPFRYHPPADYLVKSLKFHGHLTCGAVMGHLLAESARALPKPDLIVPIPLHGNRLRQRGFNQALEIARPISRLLDIPIVTNKCVRRRSTVPQSGLSAKERRANVRGAFAVHGLLSGLHVVVLDDVVTTGHTVNEFTRAILATGAQRVDVWCFARAASKT